MTTITDVSIESSSDPICFGQLNPSDWFTIDGASPEFEGLVLIKEENLMHALGVTNGKRYDLSRSNPFVFKLRAVNLEFI